MDPVRFLRSIGWLAAALIIALGAGGVVAFGDRPPGDATRPELTARADAETAAALGPIYAELGALQAEVTELGRLARAALGELNARDLDAIAETLAAGDGQMESIQLRTLTILEAYGRLPHQPTSARIGARTRERLNAVAEALRAIAPVGTAWQALAGGTRPAAELVDLLEEHDRIAFEASQHGSEAEYQEALEDLDRATATLDQAEAIRNRLANTTDTETLDEWLRRNRAYDGALQQLYEALLESGGEVSDAVREAFAEVQRRQELLPPDTRSLVVIMADVAQGGLNQAAVAIEAARGRLAAATSTLH